MATPDAPDEPRKFSSEDTSHEVFSSEKREDIWALLIALGILVLSVVFPEQIHAFFGSALMLF